MENGNVKPAKFATIGYTLKANMRQYAMLVALIVIMLFFQIATNGILLVPMNVTNLILQNSYVLILAIGMTLCILTGGNIDLSVGSVLALAGVVAALAVKDLSMPIPLAMLLGILTGSLCGLINGVVITKLKLPPFIATLGMMLIARGVALTRTGHQEDAYHSTAWLKPLHGVSLHAVLVLPALALLLDHTPWSEKVRQRVVTGAVCCYAAAVVGAGVRAALTY